MIDGMIFIWVEKEFIYDIVKHLESMNFFYVENVCYIGLNHEKEKGEFIQFLYFLTFYFCYFRG